MGQYSMHEALQAFLQSSRISGDIRALQLEEVWEDIMGKTIARHTDKLQVIGDKLIITTSVAPLRQELLYQREKIRHRVNESLKENLIREVIVR
ncbi:MAG: hypothetical protein RJA57_1729 [Bacteroidota bacterium]|jgi:hypothetical protein